MSISLNFSKGSKQREQFINLCKDTISGKITQYGKSVDEGNEIISKTFKELLGTDKLDYKSMRYNPNLGTAFSLIEEVVEIKIQEGFKNNPFFNSVVEFKNVKIGDRPEFYIKHNESIMLHKVSAGNWDTVRRKLNAGQRFLIPTDYYTAKVYTEFEQMISGRVSFTDLIDSVYEGLKEKIAEQIALVFMDSFTSLPEKFKHAGTFDLKEFRKLIAKVKALNPNSTIKLCGTATALGNIPDTLGKTASFLFSDDMKKEINNKGILSVWEGHQLVEIPQVFVQDGDFEFGVRDDIIYIMAGDEKPVKFVTEGDLIIFDSQNPMARQDMTMEFQPQIKMGVGVLLNKYFASYRIK